MSKGSKVIPFRLSDLYLAALDEAVRSANRRTKGEPYDRSSWIRKAVTEKLDHLRRSKRKKSPKSEDA